MPLTREDEGANVHGGGGGGGGNLRCICKRMIEMSPTCIILYKHIM